MLIIKEMMPNRRLVSAVNVADGGGSGRNGTTGQQIDWASTNIQREQTRRYFDGEITKEQNRKKDYEEAKRKCSTQKQICNEISANYLSAKAKIDDIGEIGGKSLDSGDLFGSGSKAFLEYADALDEIIKQCDSRIDEQDKKIADLQRKKPVAISAIIIYY